MLEQSSFKSYIPLQIIEKGKKDTNGNVIMKMQGIASTTSKDSDGENLNPKGYELDYFLDKGFMNWNHQTNTDPLAIVGRPTEAKITKGNELGIGFKLFGSNPRAKEVYRLGEILEEQGLHLGLSIEGEVIERDKNNPKIVTKAKITGCAITPNPKNSDAIATIVKGHADEFKHIIDAFNSSDEDEDAEKGMTTGNTKALAKESLDGDLKSNIERTPKKLKKGEVLEDIFTRFPSMKDEDALKLFNLVKSINKSIIMENNEVTISPEALSKAYETLGLLKGEVSEEATSKEETKTEEFELFEGDDLEKGEAGEELSNEEIITASREILEAEGYVLTKGEAPEVIEDTKEDVKGVEEIEKGLNADPIDSGDNVSDLIKGHFDSLNDTLNGKFEASATIIKGLEDQLSAVTSRLETVENTPNQKKTITTQKKDVVEKSFEGNELEGEKAPTKISKSGQKQILLKALDSVSMDGNGAVVDKVLFDEQCKFEAANVVGPRMIEEMAKQNYVIVQ
jgi:hypothetical protein